MTKDKVNATVLLIEKPIRVGLVIFDLPIRERKDLYQTRQFLRVPLVHSPSNTKPSGHQELSK